MTLAEMFRQMLGLKQMGKLWKRGRADFEPGNAPRRNYSFSSQSGFSVPELVAAIPIIVVLGMAMLNIFYTGSRHYREFLGDWELIQQVRVPMEEISRDIRYCSEMKISPVNSKAYVLQIRRHYLTSADHTAEEYWQKYKFTRRGDKDYWITKNDQPIMGKTDLTQVVLEECFATIEDSNKARVAITGVNQATGHKFRLARTFYTYGYGLGIAKDEEVSADA